MKPSPTPLPTNFPALGLGLVVSTSAAVMLLGRWLALPTLQTVLPNLVTMKANAAAALAACGVVLALQALHWPASVAIQRLLLVAVAVLAALTLSQDLFGWSLQIDEALFREVGSPVHSARPGRMSPPAALSLLLTVAALLTLTLRAAWRQTLALALGLALLIIGGLAIFGQLSNIAQNSPAWNVKATALHTSLAFSFLGAGIVLLARQQQREPWVLGWRGTTGFAVGVALMVAASNLAFQYAGRMRQQAAITQGDLEQLAELASILSAMRALESSQRGYVVLGEESLLAPRPALKDSLAAGVSRLRSRTAAEGGSLAPLDQLQALIDERIAFGEQNIARRRSQGFEAAEQELALGVGIRLTARIETLLDGLKAPALQNLRSHRETWERASGTTVLVLPLGMLLSLVSLTVGIVFLNRTLLRTRQAQLVAQESGQRLAGILESATDAVISVDANQRVVLFNGAAERMFGYPRAQAIGQPLDRFVPERSRAAHAGHLRAFSSTGVTSRLMGTLGALHAVRHDGTEFPIEASISQIEQGGEKVYTVILRDVTQRALAEQVRLEGEQRLKAVTENLSEGLVLADTGGQILHWNPAALAMHGLGDVDLARKWLPEFANIFELRTLDGALLPMAQWPLSQLLSGVPVRNLDVLVRRLDRDWQRAFSYSGAVVRYAPDRELAFLSIADITERETSRQQIQQLNSDLEKRVAERTAQLEAKSRELESFCYSVSHDLKAPLRGIDGYSRLLLEDHAAQLDEDGRTCATNVRIATQQMTALIEDLLTYSRQERRHIAATRIDLRAFVEEQLSRRQADLAGVHLMLEVSGLEVLADREALAMALRNLIDNALKFSAHRDKPAVTIRSRVEGARCVLSVQDNGAGFDMRFHDRIFEIFQRLHRVEDYPGTGIGLALVRKAAERMGGRVWAASTPGNGATFHLELQLAETSAAVRNA